MRGKSILMAMKSLMGKGEPITQPPEEPETPRKEVDEATEDRVKGKKEKKTEQEKPWRYQKSIIIFCIIMGKVETGPGKRW